MASIKRCELLEIKATSIEDLYTARVKMGKGEVKTFTIYNNGSKSLFDSISEELKKISRFNILTTRLYNRQQLNRY